MLYVLSPVRASEAQGRVFRVSPIDSKLPLPLSRTLRPLLLVLALASLGDRRPASSSVGSNYSRAIQLASSLSDSY